MKRALPLLLLAACAHAPRSATPAARLWLAGDVELGAGQGQLEPLRPLVASLGIGAVNLEGPVVTEARAAGEPRKVLNGVGALPQLASLGVKVVGIANNHALDVGPEGPTFTGIMAGKYGLIPAGGIVGPARVDVGGLRVVVTAHDLTHGVPATLADELRAARAKADVLIATFHVTGPPTYLPRPELEQAAEIALEAGAKVVAAHGTHAIGPIERRGGAVIAWGLGNVAFACDCTDVSDAILLGLRLDGPRVQVTVVPIDAGLKGQPARPSSDPGGIFDLLEAVGTPKLQRHGATGELP